MANLSAFIVLCPDAASKVHQLREQEGDAQLMLRAFISGGGCSGFQYGFSFEQTMNEDDRIHEGLVPVLPTKWSPSVQDIQAWQVWTQDHQVLQSHEMAACLTLMSSDDEDQRQARIAAWGFYHRQQKPNDPKIKVLIDPISYQYLKGAQIDYRSDASGQRFIVRNPNAKTTCGCGSSFSTG